MEASVEDSRDEPGTQRGVDETVPDELLMALPLAPTASTAAAQKPSSSSSSKVKRLAHAKAPPQPKRPAQRPKALGEPKAVGDTCLEGLYTIIDSIGRGSFGEIWLVKHTRTAGDECCLKEIVFKGLSRHEISQAKLEVDVLRRISHPHVVKFISHFEDLTTVAILMEYAQGGDLGQLIQQRVHDSGAHFAPTQIVSIALQVGSCLAYLHNEIQLLHRDIKPSNIFMRANGDACLGDFGMCELIPAGPRINLIPRAAVSATIAAPAGGGGCGGVLSTRSGGGVLSTRRAGTSGAKKPGRLGTSLAKRLALPAGTCEGGDDTTSAAAPPYPSRSSSPIPSTSHRSGATSLDARSARAMGHRDGGHKAGPKTTAAAAAANVAAAREAVFASVGAGIVGAGAKGGGVLSKRGKKSQREGVQPVKAAVKASNPYDDAVGTPVYMSPEHINGAPFDRDADVWAFGCTLYETMLLAPPWVELDDGYGGMDGGMPALLKLLTTTSLDVTPLREHYPSPLCSLLGRLLHGQLSKRIPLDEFLEELGTIPLWAGASALAPAPAPDPAPAPAEAPALLDRRRRPSGEDST